jgi:hypothetical protein
MSQRAQYLSIANTCRLMLLRIKITVQLVNKTKYTKTQCGENEVSLNVNTDDMCSKYRNLVFSIIKKTLNDTGLRVLCVLW